MVTQKQVSILRRLYRHARSLKVYSTTLKQEALARELGISRQALSSHLRELREQGYLRTGRGFIDITDKALVEIGKAGDEAFVLIRVKPSSRKKIFEEIRKLNSERIYRVTGNLDIIAVVDVEKLKEFLNGVERQEGIEVISSHVVIEMHQV
ncbi:MAG TPA: Lrp/AsnC family transcriptional regulator [Euryarchaeota archaeon]|nr:marR family protein [archaeon BMS3Bbin15]HDL16201.1 Lrp/AsnC family transcriptional regulator [Euryarchaeota archaeon]